MFFRFIISRLLLMSLIVSAMYASLSSISNITFFELMESLAEQHHPNVEAIATNRGSLNDHDVLLKEKLLLKKINQSTYVSTNTIERPETLDEVVELSQYPSKKVVATGYTAGVESTGKTADHPQYGITYSGVKV